MGLHDDPIVAPAGAQPQPWDNDPIVAPAAPSAESEWPQPLQGFAPTGPAPLPAAEYMQGPVAEEPAPDPGPYGLGPMHPPEIAAMTGKEAGARLKESDKARREAMGLPAPKEPPFVTMSRLFGALTPEGIRPGALTDKEEYLLAEGIEAVARPGEPPRPKMPHEKGYDPARAKVRLEKIDDYRKRYDEELGKLKRRAFTQRDFVFARAKMASREAKLTPKAMSFAAAYKATFDEEISEKNLAIYGELVDTYRKARVFRNLLASDRPKALEMAQNIRKKNRPSFLRAVFETAQDEGVYAGLGPAQRTGIAIGRGGGKFLESTIELFDLTKGTEDWHFYHQLQGAIEAKDPLTHTDDWWLHKWTIGAGEQAVPFAAFIAAGGVAGTLAKGAGAGLKLARAAQVTGITAAVYPQQFQQTQHALLDMGMPEDRARGYASVAAVAVGAIEGIVPNPLSPLGVSLRQSAVQMIRQHIKTVAGRFAGELSEEYLQGVAERAVMVAARKMEEIEPTGEWEKKLLTQLHREGWSQMKQAFGPLVVLMGAGGAPGMVGVGLSVRAALHGQPGGGGRPVEVADPPPPEAPEILLKAVEKGKLGRRDAIKAGLKNTTEAQRTELLEKMRAMAPAEGELPGAWPMAAEPTPAEEVPEEAGGEPAEQPAPEPIEEVPTAVEEAAPEAIAEASDVALGSLGGVPLSAAQGERNVHVLMRNEIEDMLANGFGNRPRDGPQPPSDIFGDAYEEWQQGPMKAEIFRTLREKGVPEDMIEQAWLDFNKPITGTPAEPPTTLERMRERGKEATKQPWEMTRKEFEHYIWHDPEGRELTSDTLRSYRHHKDYIKEALSEGKVVAEKVLAEYPDLVEEAPPSAAETRQKRTFGAGPGGGVVRGERLRPDQIPEALKAEVPEVERRLKAAHGIKPPGLFTRAGAFAKTVWAKATRPQEFLPNIKRWAFANEKFRLLKEVANASKDQTTRDVNDILDPLGPKQKGLFERKLLMDNLVAAVEDGQPLRFGFETVDQAKQYQAKLDGLAAEVPEVQEALANRNRIVNQLAGELAEFGLLPAEAAGNAERYFHQQVALKLRTERLGTGTKARPVRRSFQKKRLVGPEELAEEYDYNTDYIEAESEWMTEARIELAKEKWLRDLDAKESILPTLQQQAKERETTWRQVLHEDFPDYEPWQPRPGNLFYKAFTIPEKLAEQLEAGAIDQLELTADQLKEVLALGGPRRVFVLPKRIVSQLASMDKPKPSGVMGTLARELMSDWKAWTLLQPKRALAYNLRNFTGDIDPVLGGAPKVVAYTKQATKELYDYYKQRGDIGKDIKEARDLGVISSGITAQEIPNLRDLAIFHRFYGQKRGAKAKIEGYFDTVKRYTEFRENMLRYAAYLYYKDALAKGKTINYGGARAGVVENIRKTMGTEAAAAHLARNLLGDYGNMTVLGNWLRSFVIPFWSFQEINLKRYPRMVVNALDYGARTGTVGKGLVRAGTAATAGSVFAGLSVARVGWAFAALWIWNNLIQPDDEEDIAIYDRRNPHLNLGHNADGTVRVFRNPSAIGDFAEWFGLNTLVSLLPRYKSGQLTLGDIAKEMAKDPANKAVQGVSPHLKGPWEVATGQSLFPEFTEPRAADRGEHATAMLGLRDEFKLLRGQIAGTGETVRPHYLQRLMMGVTDPRQNAMSEIHQLRRDFLDKKGEVRPGGGYPSLIKHMREAAQNEDFEAFKQAKKVYIEKKNLTKAKAFASFKKSLTYLDPVHARLRDDLEREFENDYLTPLQKEKLKVARDYAKTLRVTLLQWWRKAP